MLPVLEAYSTFPIDVLNDLNAFIFLIKTQSPGFGEALYLCTK